MKRRYDGKKQFVKLYKKNLWKIEHQILHIKNADYQENSELRLFYEKYRYQENLENKMIYQKVRCQENREKQI